MANGDSLTDDRMDVRLRDLLEEWPRSPQWESGQHALLFAWIARSDDVITVIEGDCAPDVVQIGEGGRATRTDRRWIGAAAAAIVVLVGVLAFANRRPTTTSEATSPGSSLASEASSATDLPVATDVADTCPPITGLSTVPGSGASAWPPVFPVVRSTNGEIVQLSSDQISLENPPSTSGVVGKLDGDWLVDLVQVGATDREAYLAAFERLFGPPSETVIDDVTVLRFPNVDHAPLLLVRSGSGGLAIIIQGWDSEAFLDHAGLDFASVSRDPSRPAGHDLVLSFDRLPAGYEVLAPPRSLERGAYEPVVQVFPGDGSIEPSSGVYVSVEREGSVWPVQPAVAVERVDVDTWWMTGAPVSTYAWRIDGEFWVVIRNARDLDAARAWADRIELVDADRIELFDGGWRLRESEGATPAAGTLAEQATTSTLAGQFNRQVVRVLVANASTVNGAASSLTTELANTFGMLAAVNSSGPLPFARSVVYYASGSDQYAQEIATLIDGADVLPIPDELPIDGGNDALLGPDIVDGHSAVDVLVMLGNDHAPDYAMAPGRP